jgi:hypothetical protein
MIKLDFTKTDGVNTLVDAIWLDENHVYTDAEIEQMKQERFDNYVAIITAPQVDLVEDPSVVAVDGVVI